MGHKEVEIKVTRKSHEVRESKIEGPFFKVTSTASTISLSNSE